MNLPRPTITVRGVPVFKGFLDAVEQAALVDELRVLAESAPFYRPMTPSGKQMSVRMTAAGQFGWYSDHNGYRYIPCHPEGNLWPTIPQRITDVWRALAPDAPDPQCCLINYYSETTRMGLHQDKDEACFDWPVVSISLGDSALFRLGNVTRGGKTESVWLDSGDVCVMGGEARLIHHGIDRIRFGSSNLLAKGGRINLTLRVVT